MQIKTLMRYHLTERLLSKRQQITSVGKDMQKKKPSCTIDGNVSWCSHYGKQDESPQKIKIELPYDPSVPLLGVYLKKKHSF